MQFEPGVDAELQDTPQCAKGGAGSVAASSMRRASTEEWKDLAVNDLVQLACGERGGHALWPGEVGRLMQDRRHGSAPFQVMGPRGERAWFRGESLVIAARRGETRRPSIQGEQRKPLIQQVVESLDPQAHLDFPKVTDICEAAARNPEGADVAMAILVATLGQQELKAGDTRSITQDYVKVLTIFNEMLYNNQLVEVLRRTLGLKPALERLRDFREGRMGDTSDENIRMLATEVEKRVFEEGGRSWRPTPRTDIIAFCPSGHLISWKDGLGLFHVHARRCALCEKDLPRTAERYNCRTCNYYDVCVSCVRWGAPRQTQSIEPVPRLTDFLATPTEQ